MNPRDHLANERTFLAWVRTSIALLGFGVLIAKLRFLGLAPHAGVRSAALGMVFAASGIVSLLLAAWHYDRTRRMIESGQYQPATHLIFAFATAVLALGVACVVYLLTILN